MLLHLPSMKDYPTYVAVVKSIIKNWVGSHSANIEELLPKIAEYASILQIEEDVLWDRLSKWELPKFKLQDIPKILPLSTLDSAKKSNTKLAKSCIEQTKDYFDKLSDDEWKKRLADHGVYGVTQFLSINGK